MRRHWERMLREEYKVMLFDDQTLQTRRSSNWPFMVQCGVCI